jgi:hypothetical protein
MNQINSKNIILIESIIYNGLNEQIGIKILPYYSKEGN